MPCRSAYSLDPVQCRPRLGFEVADQLGVAGPALVLVHEHDVQRSGVGVTVIRRMRPLLEGRHLAVTHLVQDAARILVAEVIDARALPSTQDAQRGCGEFRGERQRLQAREDAVAAEHRHEPRQAGGRQGVPCCERGRETQGRQVDNAALVGRLQ